MSLTRRKSFFSGITLSLIIMASAIVQTASSQGNLLITPRRVVFEGKTKSFDLNLANIGKDTARYAISLMQVRMKDDGTFETITEPDPGQRFADPYIRYFPRTVTLGPNEAQTIKVQLSRTKDLQPGEYRSHFYFRAVQEVKPLGEEEKVTDTTVLTVRLTPIFGISIPVLIRVGETNTKVVLSDLALSYSGKQDPLLSFTFNRSGNMSVYGDVAVDHISSQGVVTRLGIANGVAVYTPNTLRKFQLTLSKTSGIDLKKGTIRVYYSAPSDVKPLRYAEAELPLN